MNRPLPPGLARDAELANLWRCKFHDGCWASSHISTAVVAAEARRHCAQTCRCWRHAVLRWAYLHEVAQ